MTNANSQARAAQEKRTIHAGLIAGQFSRPNLVPPLTNFLPNGGMEGEQSKTHNGRKKENHPYASCILNSYCLVVTEYRVANSLSSFVLALRSKMGNSIGIPIEFSQEDGNQHSQL